MLYFLILHYQRGAAGFSYQTKKGAEKDVIMLNGYPGVGKNTYSILPVIPCKENMAAEYYLVVNQNGKLIRHNVWETGLKHWGEAEVKKQNRYLIGVAKRKLLAVCANCDCEHQGEENHGN